MDDEEKMSVTITNMSIGQYLEKKRLKAHLEGKDKTEKQSKEQ
jgi:hypothetical protein